MDKFINPALWSGKAQTLFEILMGLSLIVSVGQDIKELEDKK